MVRKGQITDFSLDISPIFMFIVLHNHWFDLLLPELKQYHSQAGEFLQWKKPILLFASDSKTWFYELCKKMRFNWSIPLFELIFLSEWRFEIFLQSLNRIYQTSIRDWFGNFFFDPCIKILAVQNYQTCYHLWCIYVTEIMFLSEYWRRQGKPVHFWSWFLAEGEWFFWLLVSVLPYLKFSILGKQFWFMTSFKIFSL